MKIKHIACLFFLPIIYTHANNQIEKIFTLIYETNYWESRETVSGPGSEIHITEKMRRQLSELLKKFEIRSIADAPCGDFNWMKHVDLGSCSYIGIDIVQDLIETNNNLYGSATRRFIHHNLIEEVIERVDLILCRDMLAHLTYEQIFRVIQNFKKSGSTYLLATTGITTTQNHDIQKAGGWRKLNLELPPFNFPKPLALIEEDVPFAGEHGKHLGLWLLEDL